ALLTNHHVVNGCDQLLVRSGNGEGGTASVEAIDGQNDLALLRTSLRFTDAARFRIPTRPGRLGEFVGVVGYPLTGFLS
ncbi:serine protease, partial [Acinetobacter baumannii]